MGKGSSPPTRTTVGITRAARTERRAKVGEGELKPRRERHCPSIDPRSGVGREAQQGRAAWAGKSRRAIARAVLGGLPNVQTAHLGQVEVIPAIPWRHVLSPGVQKSLFFIPARGDLLKRRPPPLTAPDPVGRGGSAGPVCRPPERTFEGGWVLAHGHAGADPRQPTFGNLFELRRRSPRRRARPLRGCAGVFVRAPLDIIPAALQSRKIGGPPC